MNSLSNTLQNISLKPIAKEDELTSKLLELLERYQALTKEYKELYQQGFLELSRANSFNLSRFGIDKFDQREYPAGIHVKTDGLKFEVSGNNEKAIEAVKKTAKELESKELELINLESKEQKVSKEPKEPKHGDNKPHAVRNPIHQFSPLPPLALRNAQKLFKLAVEVLIEVENLRREIGRVLEDLEGASAVSGPLSAVSGPLSAVSEPLSAVSEPLRVLYPKP